MHLLAILRARGVGLSEAVALGTLIGPAQVAARLAEMLFGTRLHPLSTMAAALGLVAGGVSLSRDRGRSRRLALVLFGAGNGIFSIARGTLPLALFGADGYATTMGRLALPSLVAQALAPSLGALLIGRFGAQTTLGVLAALATANLAAVAVLWNIARRPRHPTTQSVFATSPPPTSRPGGGARGLGGRTRRSAPTGRYSASGWAPARSCRFGDRARGMAHKREWRGCPSHCATASGFGLGPRSCRGTALIESKERADIVKLTWRWRRPFLNP